MKRPSRDDLKIGAVYKYRAYEGAEWIFKVLSFDGTSYDVEWIHRKYAINFIMANSICALGAELLSESFVNKEIEDFIK